MPIFVKIGQRVAAWRGVEFWPFPLTCVVAFTTLSQSLTTVRVCDINVKTCNSLKQCITAMWDASCVTTKVAIIKKAISYFSSTLPLCQCAPQSQISSFFIIRISPF